jgi:4-amino-4-deoxy-L-arabinose transferase-like glycosyltransferase
VNTTDAPIRAADSWWRVRPIFLITLLGTALRVIHLDQPTAWQDEAMTYIRAVGSYRDMLESLQRDAFAPLHYELYWCIARVFQLSLPVMRAVPMIAGVLMIPAMYFLARQFTGRRVANLVALFTACSAYMLVYSRDAKMYAEFWLFCTLAIGCYVRWLRRGGVTAWLSWVVCGLAMVGLDTLGLIVLALLPIFLLTSRRIHWIQGALTSLGLLIILAGPVGYYWKFNPLFERIDQDNLSQASGTRWVRIYNQGRDGPGHVVFTATSFLFAWEWPTVADQNGVSARTLFWLKSAAVLLLATASLGALPWPRRWRGGESDADRPAATSWQLSLWICLWLIVPAYGFYCNSIPGFLSPMQCLNAAAHALAARWWVVVALILAVAALFHLAGNNIRQRLAQVGLLCGIAALVLLSSQLVYRLTDTQPAGSVWMPRYLGMTWPAFAIALCILANRLPWWPLCWIFFALLVAVNLDQFVCRIATNFNVDPDGRWLVTGSEPPIDLMARDVIVSDAPRRQVIGTRTVIWSPRSSTRVYAQSVPHNPPGPGYGWLSGTVGQYELSMLGMMPLSAREFRAMRQGPANFFFDFQRNTNPQFVARDVARHPQIDRVIVWDASPPANFNLPDPLIRRLGKGWNLVSDERFEVLDHWRWLKIAAFRRREYRRRVASGAASDYNFSDR